GVAKIAGFSLSSVLKQVMSKSHGYGAPAYKDPVSWENNSYKRGKKADIFSLGVILWEISSGQMPCEGHTESIRIIVYRLKGSRDPPFSGTPEEYVNLYSECWNEDPSKRSSCEYVYEQLMYYDKLNDLLEIEPNNTCVLNNRGAVYLDLKKYDSALIDLNKALEIEPNDTYALSRRGVVYLDLKQHDNALVSLNRALEIEPDNTYALNRRGDVYLCLKQYEHASISLNKALEIEPNDTYALSRRGYVYLCLKQYDNALIDLNRALEIEPDNTYALSRSGAVYLDLKQYDNALIHLSRALEIEPNNTYALSIRETVMKCWAEIISNNAIASKC